jgi:hypothetical protein
MVRLSALGASRSSPPRNIPGTHFCQRLSRHRGHSAVEKIRSTEKSNDLIGTWIHDLPACSTVPQPTMLLHAPLNREYTLMNILKALDSIISMCRLQQDILHDFEGNILSIQCKMSLRRPKSMKKVNGLSLYLHRFLYASTHTKSQ